MQRLNTVVIAALLFETQGYQLYQPVRKATVKNLLPSPSIEHSSSRMFVRMANEVDPNGSSSDQLNQKTSLVTTILYPIGASTSMLVSGTFFVALAVQRDALMVTFFIGAITNGVLSKVLKKILNQDRPSDLVDSSIEKPSDKGMPSSHAMSLGFIGTFTMLTLEWTRLFIPAYVALSLYYRVRTRLHTIEQVAVGMVFGVANGYIWKHLADGTNPFGINFMAFFSSTVLNDQGLLPIPLLVVPALAGIAVVGSIERKISKVLKKKGS
jgi:membrane-associated phospholipid phosphatase